MKHAVITSMCVGACAGAISWMIYQMMKMDDRLADVEAQLAVASSVCARSQSTNYAEVLAPAAPKTVEEVVEEDEEDEEDEDEDDELDDVDPPPPPDESEDEDMPP